MHASTPTAAPAQPSGTNCPSTHPESTVAQSNQPALMGEVGQERHSHSGDMEGLRHLLNERHEAWLREQYLRDLAAVSGDACFFCAMGGIGAARAAR